MTNMMLHPAGPAKFDPEILLQQLELLAATPRNHAASPAQRQLLIQAVRRAAIKLETPFEAMQRLNYCSLPLVAARIAQDHKIFDALAKTSADNPIDLIRLSAICQIDLVFLETLMDYLCTQYMADQVAYRRYVGTPLSNTLVDSMVKNSFTQFHDIVTPAFCKLNTWIRQSISNSGDKSSPAPPLPVPFQLSQNTTDDFYTWLTYNPENSAAFYNWMTAQFSGLPTWLSVVDVPGEFGTSSDNDVLMVDVGGGKGIQCTELRAHHPDLKGRIILEDLPDVIKHAQIDPSIEKVEYDYCQPQPIHHAKIYYFRQILHNNDDATCRTILRNQAAAMSPSSVLIIDDKAMPDWTDGVSRNLQDEYTAGLSMTMKVMFNAQERRESHWRRLVRSAGLEVVEVRRFTEFNDSAIMCRKTRKTWEGKL